MMQEKIIILFDGVCNLCNGLIQFIIPRDPKGIFVFAPLQSETAKSILKEKSDLNPHQMDSVVVFSNGKVFQKSRAAMEIFNQLNYPWKLLILGKFLPLSFTDWIYDFVGRHRYKWFGKQEQCMIPRPEIMSRFLK